MPSLSPPTPQVGGGWEHVLLGLAWLLFAIFKGIKTFQLFFCVGTHGKPGLSLGTYFDIYTPPSYPCCVNFLPLFHEEYQQSSQLTTYHVLGKTCEAPVSWSGIPQVYLEDSITFPFYQFWKLGIAAMAQKWINIWTFCSVLKIVSSSNTWEQGSILFDYISATFILVL